MLFGLAGAVGRLSEQLGQPGLCSFIPAFIGIAWAPRSCGRARCRVEAPAEKRPDIYRWLFPIVACLNQYEPGRRLTARALAILAPDADGLR